MKKILLILILFIGYFAKAQYNPSLHLTTNKAVGISQANPVDARTYFYDVTNFVYRPYVSTSEVTTYLNLAKYRVGQFDIVINSGGTLTGGGVIIGGTNTVWYFKDSTGNGNLVQKIFGASTTDSSIFATHYDVDTAKVNLRISIAGKLSTTLNSGQILVGNGSNVAIPVTPSNDVTVTSGGSFTVKNQWRLIGNSGTTDLSNFIGTTDNVPLSFKVNNFFSGRIDNTNANAFFGYRSGGAVSSANNTAIGHAAMLANSSGGGNAALGTQSLFSNTFGNQNTALGYNALSNNTTGANNTVVGANTGLGLVTGSYNTIVGSGVGSLAAALNNNIILSDGQGNIRLQIDSLATAIINSTTALGLPSGNTAQRPSSAVAGYTRWNTDSTAKETFNGSIWVKDGSGGGGGGSGTVTSVGAVIGTSGTDFNIGGTSPITTAGTFTFNLPIASSTNTGKLSNTDWSTFNGKQPAGSYITALTGDVAASGPGSAVATIQANAVTTTKINNNAVTYAKMQAMTANKLLGSGASGTAVAEITLGTGLSFSGTTLNATGGGGSGNGFKLILSASAPTDTTVVWVDTAWNVLRAWPMRFRAFGAWTTKDSASGMYYDPVGNVFSNGPPFRYLVLGQSNPVGPYAYQLAVNPYIGDTVYGNHVTVWDSTLGWKTAHAGQVPYDNSVGANYTLLFAKKVSNLTGRSVRIVTDAHLGEPFILWAGGPTGIPDTTIYYKSLTKQIAASGMYHADVVAWGQGENGYNNGTNEQLYYGKYFQFWDSLRSARWIDTTSLILTNSIGTGNGRFLTIQGTTAEGALRNSGYSQDYTMEFIPAITDVPTDGTHWYPRGHEILAAKHFSAWQKMPRQLNDRPGGAGDTAAYSLTIDDRRTIRSGDIYTNVGGVPYIAMGSATLGTLYADANTSASGSSGALTFNSTADYTRWSHYNGTSYIQLDAVSGGRIMLNGPAFYSTLGSGGTIMQGFSNVWYLSTSASDLREFTVYGDGASLYKFSAHPRGAYKLEIGGGLYCIDSMTIAGVLYNNFHNSLTNSIGYSAKFTSTTNNTPVAGFGAGTQYEATNNAGTPVVTGTIEFPYTNVTPASETADLVFKNIAAGTLAEKFRVKSTGVVNIATLPASASSTDSILTYNASNGDVRQLAISRISGTTYKIGALDSLSKVANGIQIVGSFIVPQTADATHPGFLSASKFGYLDSLQKGLIVDTLTIRNLGSGQVQAYGLSKVLGIATINGLNSISATTGTDSAINVKLLNDTAIGTAASYYYGTSTGGSAGRRGFYPLPSSGVTTVAFGSTPNSNGASISGTTLTIQPANGSNPGGVSTAAQVFGGSKEISGQLLADGGTNSGTSHITIQGNLTGAAQGPSGHGLFVNAYTYTDNTSATGNVATSQPANVIFQPTLAASNTGVVYTGDVATLKITGAPIAGTNVTINTPYAFYVSAGNSFFGGNVNMVSLQNYPHTIFAPSTGGSITLIDRQYNIVNPATGIATLTVTMPASPANNDVVYVKYTQAVTAVTYAGNGNTVVGGLVSPLLGSVITFVFDSGTSTWY